MNELSKNSSMLHEFGTAEQLQASYKKMTQKGLYIPMRDGVRIAVELYLPAPLPQGEKLPTLIVQTRYWRETRLRAPLRWFLPTSILIPAYKNFRKIFTSHGYALVHVDVRGTGASFGVYPHPWSEEEFEDAREVVDWIIQQPWSNGKVGSFGVSYGGTTAERLALLDHPAVKVTIPKFNHPDAFQDISHPGGVFNSRFMRYWGIYDKNLDENQLPKEMGWTRFLLDGVKPVDEDRDNHLLKQAVQTHGQNGKVYELANQGSFRNEHIKDIKVCMDSLAIHAKIEMMKKTPTQVIGWGSWMDAGTADAVIRRFLTFENAHTAIIGAWDHGGYSHASPFMSPDTAVSPPYPQQMIEMVWIFNQYLRDGQNTPSTLKKGLHYFTMGEEKWKTTTVWPPEGVRYEQWYLGNNQSLIAEEKPREEGAESYTVDFKASSGNYNRWWEMGIFDHKTVFYPNRTAQQDHLLCYTSTPLPQALEITGYPIVTLWVTSDQSDGNFFVYLEDIGPDGKATYLCEGQLRAIHRKVSDEEPPYAIQIPYHSFKQEDALPLVPGEAAELKFGLHPTSVLVEKGHCLRLSIAGHDEGTFKRIPETGTPHLKIWHSPTMPSGIELPCCWRSPD